LGEVRMAEHVCGHQDVIGKAVARCEVRTTWIAGEHHFEQARVAHVPLQQLVDVAGAERPVRHAHRQSVHGYLGHEAVGHRLEDDRIPIQSEFAREFFDLRYVIGPATIHGLAPGWPPSAAACDSAVKKWRTAAETSSGPVIEKRLHGSPASAAA